MGSLAGTAIQKSGHLEVKGEWLVKHMVLPVCILACCLPAWARPHQPQGFKGRGLGVLKPHPMLAIHFLQHHKLLLLSSGVLFAANAVYARNYINMQNRCPQCLFGGQKRPPSLARFDGLNLVGLAGATVMDYYILPLHRTDADVSVGIMVACAA